MNNQLRNMMAEMESWECATEFGVPEDLWAGYQVRQRSDDLYIALLAEVFEILRTTDKAESNRTLSEVANTLLIYSRSTASKYLNGVETNLNLLYCASIFYISGFPATATFLARKISLAESFSIEEQFLLSFLARAEGSENPLQQQFLEELESSEEAVSDNKCNW
jgi:helicase